MDFFSFDTAVEKLQCPIFISEAKLLGVWVMDMTTNAVLLPAMHSCLSVFLHLYKDALPACLGDVFGCLLVDHCVRQPIYLSYCRSVWPLARLCVTLHLRLNACQKLKKYEIILLPKPSTTRSNDKHNIQIPCQCDTITWSFHLVRMSIFFLCIASALNL